MVPVAPVLAMPPAEMTRWGEPLEVSSGIAVMAGTFRDLPNLHLRA